VQLDAAIARAHLAYRSGDLAGALALAEQVIVQRPDNAPMRQLAAVIERRRGRPVEARAHFAAALRAAPRDPHILNSFANLLLELGELQAARSAYETALQVQPGQVETLVNLALACKRLEDRAAARAALDAALGQAPDHVRASQMLGLMLCEDGEPAAAIEALDRALAGAPNDVRVLAARARAESEHGGDPGPYYARARALAPADRELALAEAIGVQRAGDPREAEARLERLAADHADFEAAHAALARLRWQDGEADRFTESYERALQARPLDPALWRGLFGALMRAGRPHAALGLLDRARPALGDAWRSFEAAAAAEAGETARADAAFATIALDEDPGVRIAYLRHLLRAGRPEAAAAFALPATERPGGDDVWPYLGTAWRLTGDPRVAWLEGHPAFIRTYDLPLSEQELAATAEHLRRLHRARSAPLDQTLRGGTQTEGSLLGRRDPEIVRLRALLSDAIGQYVAQLPPPDPAHPLLRRPREGFGFAGSWSVRLQGAGFHVNHVHTTGWISSACYIVVPATVGEASGGTDGWLAFGAPPAELGLQVEPFRKVAPKPGRLALFPSTVWHGTEPFAAGERLTVAFDVISKPASG